METALDSRYHNCQQSCFWHPIPTLPWWVKPRFVQGLGYSGVPQPKFNKNYTTKEKNLNLVHREGDLIYVNIEENGYYTLELVNAASIPIKTLHNGIWNVGEHSLPSEKEWKTLFSNVGGIQNAAENLKASNGWRALNPGEKSNGTNACGFNLLPTYYNTSGNTYDGLVSRLWSDTPGGLYSDHGAYYFEFTLQSNQVTSNDTYMSFMYSVRCVRDE
ncbi:MAG: hypothetical protein HUK21_10790 [Fibrobacteraceae bacterium]|nr:hypothetical protein [Fibrobacteraceae bacterium]